MTSSWVEGARGSDFQWPSCRWEWRVLPRDGRTARGHPDRGPGARPARRWQTSGCNVTTSGAR